MTATQPATAAQVDTFTVETIPASELRPGDVVLDDNGLRQFAAFDVSFTPGEDRHVTAFTSVRDHEAGLPDRYFLIPIAPVTVRRRTGGPRVTRTALA